MRYLSYTEEERKTILRDLGLINQHDLYNELPINNQKTAEFNLPDSQTEAAVSKKIKQLAKKNISSSDKLCFLGAGCYNHNIPAAVDHLIQRAEFLTSYTPYQPEISQGTLISIFEFQSYICNLTGQSVANASLYDGATALVEACLMAQRINKKTNILIANKLNPDYERVLSSYLGSNNIISNNSKTDDTDVSAIIVQYPDFFGEPSKLNVYKNLAKELDALLIICVTEIIALGLLPAPSDADIVVGEAQSLGVSMNFGGPHLGFFACNKEYMRQIPGRICGKTIDKNGNRAFALTLNAREQHIRRNKATSNICSNQGLNMLAFTIHLSLLGENGFKKLAKLNHYKASLLYNQLQEIPNIKLINNSFFNEFVFQLTNISSKDFLNKMLDKNIFAGIAIDEDKILVAVTESISNDEIHTYIKHLKEITC